MRRYLSSLRFQLEPGGADAVELPGSSERKNQRAPFGKSTQLRNRTVEVGEIRSQKTTKVSVNHLTALPQHGWLHFAGAGWTTLAR